MTLTLPDKADDPRAQRNFDRIAQQFPLGPQHVAAAVWPVGSIFISVVSTNPGTLLGIGTWTAFGTGRALVGIDTGQTEFDTVEETGGAKTHTLSTSEIPSHTHTRTYSGAAGGTTNQAPGGASAGTVNTGATGGGGAHNNLQPYIVVYMWKRTA